MPRDPVGLYAGLIGWGVFSLGGVHEWALWPLLAGCAIAGGSLVARQGAARGVLLAAAPILIAGILQVVPLPEASLRILSERTASLLAQFDLAFALRPGYHALSIAADLTSRAVLAFAAFTLLAAGVSASLRHSADTMKLARVVMGVGIAVAMLAIIQKATSNGKIYWIWESDWGVAANYYGPFVNRNHFAGWMVLASSMTGGLLLSQIAGVGRSTIRGWRDRVLWLGSEQAGRLVITAVALFVMLISTMWSMSRSGIAATAVAMGVLTCAAFRKGRVGIRAPAAAASILILLMAAVSWRGADVLGDWYGRTSTFEWRVQVWKDTVPALRDFWLTGSGLNTYDKVMRVYPQTDTRTHASEAHNDYLQLAVEGGLLVGLPVLLTIGLFVRTVLRRLRQPQDEATWWIRMGAVAGICGMAVQEISEFSLQIPGVAVFFALLVAIAIHEPALAHSTTRSVVPSSTLSRRQQSSAPRTVSP